MLTFLIIGGIGVVLLLVALIVGDLLEGAFDVVSGGLFSTEALAGFLGALGFGGAIVYDVTGSTAISLILGVVFGVALGAATGWVAHKLRSDDAAAVVRSDDLVERTGQVIGEIPAEGYGVVSLTVGGHITRVNARSSAVVPSGTTVVVVSVLSPTAVAVEPLFLP